MVKRVSVCVWKCAVLLWPLHAYASPVSVSVTPMFVLSVCHCVSVTASVFVVVLLRLKCAKHLTPSVCLFRLSVCRLSVFPPLCSQDRTHDVALKRYSAAKKAFVHKQRVRL